MAQYRLTEKAKQAGRLLVDYVASERIPRSFELLASTTIGNPIPEIIVFADDSSSFDELFSGSQPPITLAELEELGRFSLIRLIEIPKRHSRGFRVFIEPLLDEVVQNNFTIPEDLRPSSSVYITGGQTHIENANITNLTANVEQLADAITEKLLPAIDSGFAFLHLSIDEVREAVEALNTATTKGEQETAIRRFWSLIGKTADVASLAAIMLQIIPLLAR